MKKEIEHLIGKDIIYETASIAKDSAAKIEELTNKLDRVTELVLDMRRSDEVSEELLCIRRSMEFSRDFLSNEYVALKNGKKTDRQKLLICGFYGAKNVGDELMLEAILKLIPASKFDITILLSNNYDLDASDYAPYKILHYPKCSSDIAMIAENFDVVVWGGGAMLDDVEYGYRGQYNTISYNLMSITKAVLKSGGHALIYGVSSNDELHDDTFLNDLAFIVEKADYFSLRDNNSLQTLKKANINVDKIDVIDDLSIFNLKGEVIANRKKDKELKIGLNLILEGGKMKDYKRIISHISKYFNMPVRFILIPFYSYQKHDQLLLEQLVANLEVDVRCDIAKQPNNTKELLEIFEGCDYVFAMRYHAILISALMHKRTVMIDYWKNHRHYINKNSHIKAKYLPRMTVVEYNELCKKGLPKDLVITESAISAGQIAVWSNSIKNAVEGTLKAVKGNK